MDYATIIFQQLVRCIPKFHKGGTPFVIKLDDLSEVIRIVVRDVFLSNEKPHDYLLYLSLMIIGARARARCENSIRVSQ